VVAAANGNGNNAITVEFKPFGVSLGFTPTVLGDSTINLKVEPEVSSIDRQASIQLNGIVIPGLQTRRASTTLELRDGESFAIAGLLQRDFASTVRQVPLLGNIPILGALFRSTEFQKGDTELLIVVTPRLVRAIRPDQVRLPTDRVADPDPAVTVLTGEAYDPLPSNVIGKAATTPETNYEF
jgi:pilus assembly protein CpaC